MAKIEKLSKRDINDPEESLKDLSHKIDQLRNSLISFGVYRTNKITGQMFDDQYCFLRDSILFRANSLLFHFSLLLNIQKMQINNLNKMKINSSERTLFPYDSRDQQIFLFDSIIFHSISLFDYWGNLISYVCSPKKEMNLQWNGIIYSINDKSNTMSHSPASETIHLLNKEFVDLLQKHRSDLIHYKTDLGPAQTSSHIMLAESDFTVFAPKRFVKRFPHLKQLSKSNELTLNYVTFWLIEQTFDALDKILKKLYEHIEVNRKIEKGKEVFFFKSPDGKFKPIG